MFTGFSTAGLLINQAFQSWADSPVSTAIETRPISELTFPKVTVCPPKNTFTDLNHELMMAENTTIDEEDRKKLLYFAMDLLQDQLYDEFMFNLSIVQEENRYYNWYNGYTDIVLPRTNDRTKSFECEEPRTDYYIRIVRGSIFTGLMLAVAVKTCTTTVSGRRWQRRESRPNFLRRFSIVESFLVEYDRLVGISGSWY